jgi:hypothetical protein
MKKSAFFLAVMVLFGVALAPDRTARAEPAALFPAPFWNKDGSFAGYGYINRTGQKVIEGKFSSARPFFDGLARVGNSEKYYGYIDRTGRLVLPMKYTVANDFSEGLAVVEYNEKSSYIDKSGNFLFPPRSVNPKTFSEGMGCVAKYEGRPAWYVDRAGKTVINRSDTSCSPFREGLALMAFEPGKIGAIDKSGNTVFMVQSETGVFRPFSEGLALVQAVTERGKLFGFIDKTGRFVIAPYFADAKPFSEGLAAVSTGFAQGGAANWGYIDQAGNMVIKPQFQSAESFHEGLAGVGLNNPGVEGFIDKSGKGVFSLGETALGIDDEDYMDYKTGDLRQGFFFRDGLCKVKREDGKIQYLDKTGKKVWESEKPVDF